MVGSGDRTVAKSQTQISGWVLEVPALLVSDNSGLLYYKLELLFEHSLGVHSPLLHIPVLWIKEWKLRDQ